MQYDYDINDNHCQSVTEDMFMDTVGSASFIQVSWHVFICVLRYDIRLNQPGGALSRCDGSWLRQRVAVCVHWVHTACTLVHVRELDA